MEGAQGFVVAATVTQAEVHDLGNAGFREGGDHVANLAVGVVADGVEQRGRQLDFERFGAFNQIDDRGLSDEKIAQDFAGGAGQFGAGQDFVFAGLGIFDQRGGDGVGATRTSRVSRLAASAASSGPASSLRAESFSTSSAPAWPLTFQAVTGSGFTEFKAQVANFGGGMRKQARDLSFEGTGVRNLPSEVLVARGSR